MQKKIETPIIETSNIFLVPFDNVHLTQRYVSWLNDPEVVRFSENRHRDHTLTSCKDYFYSMTRESNLFWALMHKDDNRHIGNITAYIDLPNATAELAIMIGDRSFQGQGLGLESWKAAMEWLLGDGGFRKVTAGAMSANKRMIRIITVSGMQIEGHRKDQFILDGKEVDMIMAAKFTQSVPNT